MQQWASRLPCGKHGWPVGSRSQRQTNLSSTSLAIAIRKLPRQRTSLLWPNKWVRPTELTNAWSTRAVEMHRCGCKYRSTKARADLMLELGEGDCRLASPASGCTAPTKVSMCAANASGSARGKARAGHPFRYPEWRGKQSGQPPSHRVCACVCLVGCAKPPPTLASEVETLTARWAP